MSTSALKPSGLLTKENLHSSDSVSRRIAEAVRHADTSFAFRQQQLEAEISGKGPGKNYILLGGAVIAAHLVGLYFYINSQHTPVVSKPRPVEIEIIKPVIEPPPEVKPPPPPPPPPKKVQPPQPPKPQPALKTPEATPDIQPDDIVIQENTTAEPTTGPVEAAPPQPPAPPAPPPEEPVTEAFGGLGYLNNPPPKYPAFAARQGWQGTVVLRVRVLANGSVERIEIAKSSGRKVLDDAALSAAKNWEFAPAKRGQKPIDGWATVPVDFRLN